MALRHDTVATAWKWFAGTLQGLWRKPVEHDFAAIAAAFLRHEKEALVAPETPPVLPR
jgi:hypothetical protein